VKTVFGLTDRAIANLYNMEKRTWDIENKYGRDSDECIKAKDSLMRMFMTMIRFPGTVHAEDELSLIINSYITIGIIWHPLKFKPPGGEWEVDPLLGEWSSHS
jgi:hypothetical protein